MLTAALALLENLDVATQAVKIHFFLFVSLTGRKSGARGIFIFKIVIMLLIVYKVS